MSARTLLHIAIPVVFIAFLVQSCGEDEPTTSPDTQKAQLNGSIVKSDGKPLDSAEVVLLFHTTSIGVPAVIDQFVFPNPASTQATLYFSAPTSNTFVNVRVLDPLIGITAASPMNSVVTAGEHTVSWDLKQHPDSARSIRNGWYTVLIDVGGQVKTTPLLVNSENSTAFAVSDSTGRFFIDYRYIPRDSTANLIDDFGAVIEQFSVVDTVTVLVRRKDYTTQKKTISIDRSKTTNVKFTF